MNGSGNLLLYANGFTITSSSGSESVTIGSDTFALIPHSVETTTIENSKSNETFVYGPGFGQDTITGFLAPTTARHDHLQFSKSMFGFSSTASQTADAQALLSNFASGTTNTTITDLQGDTLTLNGVTIATLQANLARLQVHLTAHGRPRSVSTTVECKRVSPPAFLGAKPICSLEEFIRWSILAFRLTLRRLGSPGALDPPAVR